MLVLLVGVGVVVAANVAWVGLDTRPPHWDEGKHLVDSLGYLSLLDSPRAFLTHYSYYPPLVTWVTVPFYLLFGTSEAVAVASLLPFVLVLAVATYCVGEHLAGPRVGLLATVFLLAVPTLITGFKEYMLDAPLAAMAVAALYALIRCREFEDRRWAIVLGVALGLGMLTKWTFALALVLPVAAAGLVALSRGRLVNAALTLMLATAIAAVWYIPNLASLGHDLAVNSLEQGALEGDPPVLSLDSATWYLRALLDVHLYLPLATLTVIGVIVAVRRRELRYPLLMIAGTLVALTLLRNKDPRYVLVAIAPIAVVATAWLPRWGGVALAAFAAFSFLAVGFGVPRVNDVSLGPVPVFAEHGYIIGPPVHEDWLLPEYVAAGPVGFEGTDTLWFNAWGVRYYAALRGIPFVDSGAAYVVARGQQPAGEVLATGSLPDGSVAWLVRR